MTTAAREAERVARLSYGRLVALLTARLGAYDHAEDALAEALARALERWPETGIPDNPEAWLLTVARRHAVDAARRRSTAHAAQAEVLQRMEESVAETPGEHDDRLGLMFACASPEIDEGLRAPLMLQVVLGIDARRMAGAFLTSPAALGQRLSRGKARIRESGVRFSVPDGDLSSRLEDVLRAIYGAYSVGYDGRPAGDAKADGLSAEAVWLASVVAAALPDEPEAHGLFALMLFSEARRPARQDDEGRLVPLDEQDTRLWDVRLLGDARRALANAVRNATLGRFQIEAAIQALHSARADGREVDYAELERLYTGLMAVAPSVGGQTSRAAVILKSRGPKAALDALGEVPEARRKSYQPWWAVRADALARLGQIREAITAYDRAIALSDDPAARALLRHRQDRLLN